MIRIHHGVLIEPAGDDRGNDQEGRSPLLQPGLAEGLGDRDVERVAPSGMQLGLEDLAGNVRGNQRFDIARGTRRRPAVGMDQDCEEADGEAPTGIDGRQAGRFQR
nr:hypothetical protein [Siccirubricoccus phaeus]